MPTPDTNAPTLSNGPAWAAILAAGIGCAILGLLIDLAEAFKSFSNALNFYNPVGDLSGKTLVSIVLWLICWAALHQRWKNRAIQRPTKIIVLTLILVLLALLAAFPPFFSLFAAP